MSDRPASPFAKLDTNLLRSTRPGPTSDASPPPPTSVESAAPTPSPPRPQRARGREQAVPSVAPRLRDIVVDTTTPRAHDTTSAAASESDEMIGAIRKTVRAVGKEGATLRLTQAEKQRLKDLVYTYTRQGKRTSETELIRIATNYMLEDYQRHGERSVLARVIAALDS